MGVINTMQNIIQNVTRNVILHVIRISYTLIFECLAQKKVQTQAIECKRINV